MDGNDQISFAPRDTERQDGRLPPAARASGAAGKRWRGHGKLASFLACVLLPALLAAGYEYGIAADQYVSEFRFVVKEQAAQASRPNSVVAGLSGGNPMLAMMQDPAIVTQYIGSTQILTDLRGALSLDQIFATPKADWWSRMPAGLKLEEQMRYWKKQVRPSFDLTSGVVTVKIYAFAPQDAWHLAEHVLASSEALVNQMSIAARRNSLAYAEQNAAEAQGKLLEDERKLAEYRNSYSVLFPELNASASTSVGTSLSLQLAQDQVSLAALLQAGQTEASPQVKTLRARIAAAQPQIGKVAAALAAGGAHETLANVLSGYDTLIESQKLDAEMYASDLVTLRNARNAAAEKAVYLEPFVQPELPEASLYPMRGLAVLATALAGLVGWLLLTLLYNIIHDRMD